MSRPGGPFFDDLAVGDRVEPGPLAPALTLHDGAVAAHRAIVGDRLPLGLSAPLAVAVTGAPVVPPALVWDVAIGQSTALTRRVVANLFYRGLGFHRFPAPGDTLATATEVVALRRSRSRPVGMAALRVTARDQHERTVLDFHRCAMLPLSGEHDAAAGPADDLDAAGSPVGGGEVERAVAGWDLTPSARAPRGPRGA